MVKKTYSYFPNGIDDWETMGDNKSNDLVLLLHGMDCGPQTVGNLANSVLNVWRSKKASSCFILIPHLPFHWKDSADLKKLSEEIVKHLNTLLLSKSINSFTIIGHSAGGVLAQSIFMISRNNGELGKILPANIRLVLISPLNQGWEISHHLPLSKKISWSAGKILIPLLSILEYIRAKCASRERRPLWIMQLQRGSPFLTWLRLQWLESKHTAPTVVQLLGSIDEIVSWRDMVDMVSGERFLYLNVPHSDHVTILNFDESTGLGQRRREIFEQSLTIEADEQEQTIQPWDVSLPPIEPQVERVVFVIHGIRDEGHWTQKIGLNARKIFVSENIGTKSEIAIITSSYGYFSMLEFLKYGKRMEKIHWLTNKYVEARRRYPNAKFSYIAHSNGTYLLAHALENYPDMNFERVIFAGSVVSFKYNWQKIVERYKRQQQNTNDENQLGEMRVLNFTATFDWVVGLLPMIADIFPLNWLFGPNLGGAGVIPFKSQDVEGGDSKIGSHSAAIQEDNWEFLAKFAVIDGPSPEIKKDDSTFRDDRTFPFTEPAIYFICPLVILLLLTIILFYLPYLAWTNLYLFWGVPIILLFVSGITVALLESSLAHLPIDERLKKRRHTKIILLITIAAILVWFFGIVGFLIYSDLWHDYYTGQGLRTISVATYFYVISKILTKV